MTFTVRVSSHFVVDLGEDEQPLPGFSRRDRWPAGRYAFRNAMASIETADWAERTERVEEVLLAQVAAIESDEGIAGYREQGRGWAGMLFSVTPEQGGVDLPSSFLTRWGNLNGRITLDVLYDP